MSNLIDKSALVAELNRLIAELTEEGENTIFEQGRISAFEDAKLFIDILEVKEVDLEKEIDNWYNTEASKEFENVLYSDIENCAKHFFELGLSVSNKAEKKELEEEPYIMGETGKFTTTTKAQKGK